MQINLVWIYLQFPKICQDNGKHNENDCKNRFIDYRNANAKK